jgi:hypothetical protein
MMMSSLKWLITMIVLVVSVFFAGQASAQVFIDPIDVAGIYSVQVSGYAQMHYLPQSETRPNPDKIGLPDDDSDYQLGLARLKIESALKETPFKVTYEIEAVDLDDPDKNWLRQAMLSYKLNDEWSIRAGRLFLAAGYITPAPSGLETVLYPRTPFNCYAYGVQLMSTSKGNFGVIVDLTGKSGLSFNDGDNWDRLESSIRFTEKFTENLSYSVTFQLSDELMAASFDSEYRIGKLLLRGAAYSMCPKDADAYTKGFYAYGGYEIFRRFEVHGQVDRQIGENNIWTIGARIWTPNNRVSFTADYEMVDGQHDDNRVVARAQVRF